MLSLSDGNAASDSAMAGSGDVFSCTEPNMLELSGRIKDIMQGSGGGFECVSEETCNLSVLLFKLG